MQQYQDRYRLSEEEFTQAAETVPRLADKNVELARQVLVSGKGLSEVAREYGVARQSVQHYRDKLYTAYSMHFLTRLSRNELGIFPKGSSFLACENCHETACRNSLTSALGKCPSLV
jgi:FixJ family two-component response regulator